MSRLRDSLLVNVCWIVGLALVLTACSSNNSGIKRERDAAREALEASEAAKMKAEADLKAAQDELTQAQQALADALAKIPQGSGFTTRLVADLNNHEAQDKDGIADRVASTGSRHVVSSTDMEYGEYASNTGVTLSTRNSDEQTRSNVVLSARYVGDDLVFEHVRGAREPTFNTAEEPAAGGYNLAIPPDSGFSWKGAEYYIPVTTSAGRWRHVFYSDIEDNDDADYLALGYWVWTRNVDDPGDERGFFVGAAASGNDPYEVGNIGSLQGQATYTGDAAGMYAKAGTEARFQDFTADVRLTADFDDNEVYGAVSNARDVATGALVFEGLALQNADLQTEGAAFFRGYAKSVISGKYASGRWGGQFYGNSSNQSPGSVAGTFSAKTPDRSESLVGVFGAHRQ